MEEDGGGGGGGVGGWEIESSNFAGGRNKRGGEIPETSRRRRRPISGRTAGWGRCVPFRREMKKTQTKAKRSYQAIGWNRIEIKNVTWKIESIRKKSKIRRFNGEIFM